MKRIISILLALMLVASLIPSVFALEADGSQLFTFSKNTIYLRNGSSSFTSGMNSNVSMKALSLRRYTSNYSTGSGWNTHLSLILDVEKAGEYEIHLNNAKCVPYGAAPEVYITKYDEKNHAGTQNASTPTRYDITRDSILTAGQKPVGIFNFSTAPQGKFSPVKTDSGAPGTVTLDKAKYLITFSFTDKSRLANPVAAAGSSYSSWINTFETLVALSNYTITAADGTKHTSGVYAYLFNSETGNFNAITSDFKFYIKDADTGDFKELDWTSAKDKDDKKAITAINATVYQGSLCQHAEFSGIKLVPVPQEDSEYKEAFDAVEKDYTTGGTGTVNAYTYTDKEETLSLNNTVNLGESVTVTAPDKEGYNFLYWAKGAIDKKQVISYNNKLTYKPAEGANYVVAVYEEANAETNKAEFYNANGSLVATLNANGKAPKLPSMAGFGVASGWQLYGSEEIFASEADITVSGNMVFVAKYDEEPNTVIVNGEEYAYGETVRMPAIDSSKIFKGWKRNGEIVSTDKNYTFKAWEAATVEPVYADAAPVFSGKFMKIIVDAFTAGEETAVMAEFIGIDNAVEKGIKIGNTKVAMKSGDKQFSLLADVVGEYIGYAILRDGDGFIEVTDGNVEIKAE